MIFLGPARKIDTIMIFLGIKFKNPDTFGCECEISEPLSSVHFMHLGPKIFGMEHDKNNGSCAFSIVSWRTLA